MDVTGVFRDLSGAGSHVCAMLFRVNTGAQTWIFVSRSAFTGDWRLIERVAGSDTVLATYDGAEATSTDYTVVASPRGSSVTVTIDGTLRLSGTTAVTSSGRVGTYFFGAPGTAAGWQLASLAADDVAAAAAAPRLLGLTGVGT